MAAFVGGHGGGGDAVHRIDLLAEVHGLIGRIVVIGKLPGRVDHFHIGDAVFAEHGLGDLRAGEADRDLRVFVETAFQRARNEPARERGGYEDDD